MSASGSRGSIAKLRQAEERRQLGAFSRGLGSAKEMAVSLFAVMLIFFAVLGFVIVQDVNDNLGELERIKLQNPLQRLSDLRRMISEGALKDPKSAYYLQYQKASNEVSQMFESANEIIMHRMAASGRGEGNVGVVAQVYDALTFQVTGRQRNDAGSGGGQDGGVGGIGEAPESAPAPPAKPAKTGLMGTAMVAPVQAATPAAASASGPFNTNYPKVDASNCKPYNTQEVKRLFGRGNEQFLAAALDKFDDFCLAQTLDINTGSYRPSAVVNAIRSLQQELFVIGVLFLPLVGGLLGATIFVIYSVINGVSSALMPPSYIVVRIVVGGAFGVIIGWFSSTTTGSGDLIQHVSGTPFTLAFLAGFSIETLSTVLLRYSRATATASQKKSPGS